MTERQTLTEQKQAQRRAGIAARRGLSSAQRRSQSEAICRRIAALEVFREVRRVLLYAAFGGEAELSALAAGDREYCYPVCLPDCQMLAACPLGPESWEVGAYGILAPNPARSRIIPPEELELVLVPCTAFDSACRRVGMGKGYYDRFLPRCEKAVKLGVAFECQRVETAVADEFDVRLDGYVTEERIYTWKK